MQSHLHIAVLSLMLMLMVSCGVRAGNVVLLSEPFEGWVVIHYNVRDSPPFGHEGFKTLIRVPPSGTVSTISARPKGYGFDEYYFIGTDGKRVRLKTEEDRCSNQEICVRRPQYYFSPATDTIFFVGTRQDLRRNPAPEIK
jgi:hypothetical protein